MRSRTFARSGLRGEEGIALVLAVLVLAIVTIVASSAIMYTLSSQQDAASKKSGVTAWQVGQEMFPAADDVHRFLAVSEAVAHLDLAHSEGKIGVELAGHTEVYKPK